MSVFTTTGLTFVSMREEEGGVHSFVFTPDQRFPHVAGQHGFFTLPGVGMKPFSLASAPDDPEVVIGTRLQSKSKYKTALAALEPGGRASLRGPVFNFTLKGSPEDVVFLAQGVGITPFRSLLRHIASTGLDKRTTLLHIGTQGHTYRGETESLATSADYPTTREDFHVQLKRSAVDQPHAGYYISGSRDFLDETVSVLSALDISRKQIRKDKFLGY